MIIDLNYNKKFLIIYDVNYDVKNKIGMKGNGGVIVTKI